MSLPAMRFEQRIIWTDQGMSSESFTLIIFSFDLALVFVMNFRNTDTYTG
jgi:hypothetical protein